MKLSDVHQMHPSMCTLTTEHGDMCSLGTIRAQMRHDYYITLKKSVYFIASPKKKARWAKQTHLAANRVPFKGVGCPWWWRR